jgi:hypothetical protein
VRAAASSAPRDCPQPMSLPLQQLRGVQAAIECRRDARWNRGLVASSFKVLPQKIVPRVTVVSSSTGR